MRGPLDRLPWRAMLKLLAAGVCASVLLAATDARAGCGFYAPPATASAAALVNDADQVSLVRDGTRFALTMSTNYKGPAEDFAMIVPVPVVLKKEQVKTLSPAIFKHLEKMTAPRIVELAERDPCAGEQEGAVGAKGGAAPGSGMGYGGGGGAGGVKVEAEFISGEYQIVVLSASESDGLEKWLRNHNYKIPAGASEALDPYVKQQQKFVVAKVDKTKVLRDEHGAVVLSPLRFVYETQDFRLPVRLGLLNAPKGGKQDLIIYLFAKGKRMEAANLENLTIPTNVDLREEAIAKFPAFYATLLDATMTRAKGAAAVLEYAWGADSCGAPCTDKPLAGDEIEKLGADEVFSGDLHASELVLTRLHTRFDASTLKEDIVFRAADPISDGHDSVPSGKAAVDQFQARYSVRHAWTGPIECKHPQRGVWVARGGSKQAVDLAASPRDVELASLLVSPIPALALKGTPPKAHKKKAESDHEGEPSSNIAIYLTGGAAALIVVATIASLIRKSRRGSSS